MASLVIATPDTSRKTLVEKCEYAILGVLVHYHGQVESSLQHWHLSLKLALPDIENADQTKKIFKQLWGDGVIALRSPWIGDYNAKSGDNNLDFLSLDQFTVALTRRGVIRWDNIRRWPKRAVNESHMQARIH